MASLQLITELANKIEADNHDEADVYALADELRLWVSHIGNMNDLEADDMVEMADKVEGELK